MLDVRTPTRTRFAVVYWLVGAASLFWVVLPVGDTVNAVWLNTTWLFNYQTGVWRRGLLGTVLEAVAEPSQTSVMVAGFVGYAAAVGLVGWGMAALTEGDNWQPRFWTVVVLLVSPAGFPFLAANLGRHDTWLVVGAAVAIWLIHHRRFGAVWFVVAGMMLIHEAALLLVVVWLVAWMWVRGDKQPAGVAAAVGCGLGVVLGLWEPSVPFAEYTASLPITAHPHAVSVLYNKTANTEYALRLLFSTTGLFRLGKVLVLTFPVWVAASGLRNRWLAAGALAPIALVFVGVDYERWFPFAAGLAVVSVLLVGRVQPVRRLQVLAAAGGVLTVLAGGLIRG